MNLLFIRHAAAVERDKWEGDDLRRPLTRDGLRTARALRRTLLRRGIAPGLMLTSEADRAIQTAACWHGDARLLATPLLNPGCGIAGLRTLIKRHARHGTLALVGHEPDFTGLIAALIGDTTARLRLRKCGCAMVRIRRGTGGELQWLLPPP